MKGLLTNRQIRAIVARRDLLLAYLDKKETVSTARTSTGAGSLADRPML